MKPFVYVVFCDDLRSEVGNKYSMMGVYGTELLVQSFPAILPKLCAVITVAMPIDRPPKELAVRIFLGDEVVFDTPNIVSAAPGHPIPASHGTGELEEPTTLIQYAVHAVLSPVALPKPSRLRVKAYVDGEEFKGNGLLVELMKQSTGGNS